MIEFTTAVEIQILTTYSDVSPPWMITFRLLLWMTAPRKVRCAHPEDIHYTPPPDGQSVRVTMFFSEIDIELFIDWLDSLTGLVAYADCRA